MFYKGGRAEELQGFRAQGCVLELWALGFGARPLELRSVTRAPLKEPYRCL